MAIREGRWACPTCGTKDMRPKQRTCTGCGEPRPRSVRAYLPEDARVLTDPAEIQAARSGPKWYCEHCGAGTLAELKVCAGCGAAKGSSPVGETHDYCLGEAPRTAEAAAELAAAAEVRARTAEIERRAADVQHGDYRYQPPAARPTTWIKIGIAAILAGCVFLLFLAFSSKPLELTVTGIAWERSIDIEAFRTLREQGWDPPSDARILSRRERWKEDVDDFSHNETVYVDVEVEVGSVDVVVGHRDLGNDNFEDITSPSPKYSTSRSPTESPVYTPSPVYDDWYDYEIDRWVHARTLREVGQDQFPRWSDVTLAAREREGDRHERYVVIFARDDDKQHTQTFDQRAWNRYQVGQTVTAKVNGLGVITSIETPRELEKI